MSDSIALSHNHSRPFRRPGFIHAGALLALLALAMSLRFSSLLNHDSSWYLIATERWLSGSRLYVDIIEVNPPLSFLLTAPPLMLARATGMDATALFKAWVFLLSFAGLWLAHVLLKRLPGVSDGQRRLFLLVGAIALWLLPGPNFGQREHLAVIFTWPWMALLALRLTGAAPGTALATGVGAWSFFGFALKPHFLLVPAALEALLLWHRRRFTDSFRPETLMLGAALALYLAAIVLLTPEYVRDIVPMALAVYNQAYRSPLGEVFLRGGWLPPVLAAAAWLVPAGNNGWRRLADVLLTAGMALLAVYLIQRKGWSYQLVPAVAFTYGALAARLLAVETEAVSAAFWRARAALVAGGGLLGVLLVSSVLGGFYVNPFLQDMRQHGALADRPRSFVALTTNVSAGFPAANEEGLVWASRFPTLWLLPGVVRARHDLARDPASHDKAAIDRVEAYIRRAVREDFERFRPELVMVYRGPRVPYMGGLPFDFLAWLRRDAAFARIWENYELVMQSKRLAYFRRKKERQAGTDTHAPALRR